MVEEYTAIEPSVARYGLARGEKVFICHRPSELKPIMADDVDGLASRPISSVLPEPVFFLEPRPSKPGNQSTAHPPS